MWCDWHTQQPHNKNKQTPYRHSYKCIYITQEETPHINIKERPQTPNTHTQQHTKQYINKQTQTHINTQNKQQQLLHHQQHKHIRV